MRTHETHEIETSSGINDNYVTLPRKRNPVSDERVQPDQLGSLARVVMETLGLSREEALQMAQDLGFLKP